MENMEKAGKVLFSSDIDMLPEEDLAEIAGEFKTEAVDTEEDDDPDAADEEDEEE
jgi:hypothetical protein